MKNKLLTMVLTLSMMIICIGLAIPMTGQASTEGFSYDSTNFSTLDLTDKTGFSIDSDGNLVMSMQAETTSGSQLSLGGNGVSGENVRFKMIYRDTTGTGTAQYYQTKSFLQGGGFFDIYKQGKMSGSLQMSSRVINNNAELFKPSYSTVLYYNTWIIDMNTVTGESEYTFWQCTSLEQAQGKTDSTDTLRRVFNGTATTKGTVNTALTDFILSTKPSEAGTATDIIVYGVSLGVPEPEATATPEPTPEPTAEPAPTPAAGEFNYTSDNFNSLDLEDKTGFSLDEDGNLIMSMQAETTLGSQLAVGGNGVSGENVRFKIIYRNIDSTATAQYYGAKSFVKGGGFFDLYKQGAKMGSLQMSERVIYNAELFNSNYDTTLFYNTLVIDMNTVTGEAKYAFWQCTSLEQAQGKTDTSGADTVRQKAYGTGTSASGANQALGEIILNTQPIAAGTSTDIIVYEVSLEDVGILEFSKPKITEDTEVKATVSMKNTTKEGKDYVLILAAYDENEELIKVVPKGGTLNANTEAATDSISFAKPTGAAKYKAFVWDSLETIRPLVTHESIDAVK